MTSTPSADFSSEPAQVGASGILGFEERLTREILRSERTRMLILAGLSGSLVVTFPVHALRSGLFGMAWALQFVAIFVCLASYELVIRQVVGRRLEQKAEGYRATIVGGEVTYRDGAFSGALPGRLVRGARSGPGEDGHRHD